MRIHRNNEKIDSSIEEALFLMKNSVGNFFRLTLRVKILDISESFVSWEGERYSCVMGKDHTGTTSFKVSGKENLKILKECQVNDQLIITHFMRPEDIDLGVKVVEKRSSDFVVCQIEKGTEGCLHLNITFTGAKKVCSQCGEVISENSDLLDPHDPIRSVGKLTRKEYRRKRAEEHNLYR